MNRRFADTFYFIALLSADDQAHRSAVLYSCDADTRLITTRWVLAECADGFAPTGYRDAAALLIHELIDHPSSIVLPATDDWFSRGLKLYESHPDKEWSLTDCISFLVMQDMNLTEALTADHHFEQAGFIALLKEKTP